MHEALPVANRAGPRTRARAGTLLGACGLLFLASAAATVFLCRSMGGGMAMPGGWRMSMAWMRMPGQVWAGAFLMFLGMWAAMMVAMMLPSLVTALYGCRFSTPGGIQPAGNPVVFAAGYFFVWAGVGAALYPVGAGFAAATMRSADLSRCVPAAAGAVALLAGLAQLTSWKVGRLCRSRKAAASSGGNPRGAPAAWQSGLRLGAGCALCCWPFTAMLLAAGVMNPGAMALITAAITAERTVPRPEFAARAAGAGMIGASVLMISRILNP